MDLPTALAISVTVLTGGGIGLKFFGKNSRKNVVTSTSCEERREEIQKDLDRGEKKFDKIFTALEKQGKTLARIDERTLLWADKFGGK